VGPVVETAAPTVDSIVDPIAEAAAPAVDAIVDSVVEAARNFTERGLRQTPWRPPVGGDSAVPKIHPGADVLAASPGHAVT
jgi:hypothetical protein